MVLEAQWRVVAADARGFQQNLRASGIGVVVVLAKTNRVKELGHLVPQILEALNRVTAGELIRVGG